MIFRSLLIRSVQKATYPTTEIPKESKYGVASTSRLLKIIGLFDRIQSL